MKYIIYRKFATALHEREASKISQLLSYAGITGSHESWIGSRLLLALLAGLVGGIIPFSLFRLLGVANLAFGVVSEGDLPIMLGLSFLLAFGSFSAIIVLVYLHVYYLISDRSKRVEEVLPDFLLMVAANLRAGLTPYAAFQASARPEFGPLETEIKVISSKSLGTESFTEALHSLNTRIDSSILRRTVAFFENGLRSGGKLAALLETSAEELRKGDEMKRDMALNTKTYAIFLVFILVMGLPLLLSISTQFLETFARIQTQVTPGSTAGISPISSPKLSVSPETLQTMTHIIIIGTSILASVTIGVITEGKLLYGLKYSIPLMLSSGLMFYLFRALLGNFLGSLI
jgi:archaellum biogenesis protein FlaJ (TadC family)